ncbi:microtubule-actin cross-linking factor 1-like, partial [Rhinatrema bivittatum]|uniref:microtubule-actin cross-linking factor 1-like n=1 Tax=Rhinatrema bivittatum TaxID=194408 RepID=UPI0011271086
MSRFGAHIEDDHTVCWSHSVEGSSGSQGGDPAEEDFEVFALGARAAIGRTFALRDCLQGVQHLLANEGLSEDEADRLHFEVPKKLTERMDLMVECIDRLQDRFQNLPAIRGESARIREQIRDNTLVLGELEKLGVSLETIRRQAEELLTNTQAASTEPTAKGIQDRMEKLLGQWRSLQSQAEERECWLKSLLTLADRFWHGLSELSVNLNETQQIILDMEETGSDPESIKARLNTMQGLREEVDSLQNDLDTLGILGVELMSSCGDMDKPNVTKSLDDLYATWHSLNKVWNQHYKKLEERLQASLRYQEAMQ